GGQAGRQGAQRVGLEFVVDPTPTPVGPYQAHAFQQPHVMADGRLAEPEVALEVAGAYAVFADAAGLDRRGEEANDAQTGRVGDQAELVFSYVHGPIVREVSMRVDGTNGPVRPGSGTRRRREITGRSLRAAAPRPEDAQPPRPPRRRRQDACGGAVRRPHCRRTRSHGRTTPRPRGTGGLARVARRIRRLPDVPPGAP